MTFKVIEGGLPEHRRGTLSPAERDRCAVIERVAAAIHSAHADDMPGQPTWEVFVDAAYAEADTNPTMLARVSDTYREARAAIEALKLGDGLKPGALAMARTGEHVSGLPIQAVAEMFDAILAEVLE